MSSANIAAPSELLTARWFAGKHREVRGERVLDRVVTPQGALEILEVAYRDGGRERYGVTKGADGGPGRPQDRLWGTIVTRLRRGPLATQAGGRLELQAADVLDGLLGGGPCDETEIAGDQSNTLVALGPRLLLKAYRRLADGLHPEPELGVALAGTAAPVPRHAGTIVLRAPDGSTTTVALLQELVAGAESGWEAPIERLAALLRRDPAAGSDTATAGFAVELAAYAAAGSAAAELHAALALACPIATATAGDHARWSRDAGEAIGQAASIEPMVAASAATLLARVAPLSRPGGADRLGRIHGDLHLAQYLRTDERLLIVDFEGDPTAPLDARRALDTPLRDLACLVRSVDHVGSAAARRAGGADPLAWIARAIDAVVGAYARRSGVRVDPDLLTALEVVKECRELVYAHSVLPEWRYAPMLGLERLLRRRPGAFGP